MELNREKQIEEMTKDVTRSICWCNEEIPTVDGMGTAITLYNKGYRKSTDVAEEIFAEIDDFQRTLRHIFLDMCGGNDYNTLNLLQIDSAIEALYDFFIAELKKKYTEGGE